MKINVDKEGKKKTYNLINKWSDVTLEKWLKLVEFEGLSKTEETLETINLLSTMPKKIIRQLSIQDVAMIMKSLNTFQQSTGKKFRKIFSLDNIDYGWHPNLEELTLGEWADIETFVQDGIQKNMPKIMAVLFRPIKERQNDAYIIEAYDGNIAVRAEKFKKMNAEQVQSALVFFWTFVNELLKISLSYLKEHLKEVNQVLETNPLQKSGDISECSTDCVEVM